MVHACEIDIPELLGASKWIVYNVKDVGGQNSSPQFISRVGTASSDFGVVGGKMGKWHKIYCSSANRAYVHLVFFLLIIGPPLQ